MERITRSPKDRIPTRKVEEPVKKEEKSVKEEKVVKQEKPVSVPPPAPAPAPTPSVTEKVVLGTIIPTIPNVKVEPDTPQPADGRIWFRNYGKTFRLGKNRIVKPGEKFKAFPHEVSPTFRDVIRPQEPLPEEPVLPKISMSKYDILPSKKQAGMFDLVSLQGKILNEIPLTKEKAEKLKTDLER